MTAHLTLYLKRALMERVGLAGVTHALLGRIQRTAKSRLEGCIARYGGAGVSEKQSHGKARLGSEADRARRDDPAARASRPRSTLVTCRGPRFTLAGCAPAQRLRRVLQQHPA